jgi:aspartyl-tRNA(Asn)/glutamyl-tRNA(Gln) amidotransferase subunit A
MARLYKLKKFLVNNMELTALTAKELATGYRAGDFTVTDVARAYLEKIAQDNPRLNAYLEVFDDVMAQAECAQARVREPDAHPLCGVPIAVKDNILIEGKRASAASKMLENHRATYDATAIKKLKDAGAIFLGRTNMDEFAFGSSTENSAFGPTCNPHAPDYVAGGTSGGSAAAVAAHLAPIALGTDTGGSVRNPASYCGVVGMKPTYGGVSRSGLIAAASSFDQIGVLARTVDDAELVLETISGHDPLDATTLPPASPDDVPNTKRAIGVPRAFFTEGIDVRVTELLDATLETLQKKGYELVDIELPNIRYALATYYILIFAEESTNLSRFDGMRYGLHVESDTLIDEYKKTRAHGFGFETKRRIILGTYVLSAGYYDAYYARATALRSRIVDDFEAAFKKVDAVIMPTSPTLPFKIGEKNNDPLAMYLTDIFTVSPNLAGLPAISIPVGYGEKEGVKLPVGMQYIAPRRGEDILFTIARDTLSAG